MSEKLPGESAGRTWTQRVGAAIVGMVVMHGIGPTIFAEQQLPGADTRALMKDDAPINIIYLPSSTQGDESMVNDLTPVRGRIIAAANGGDAELVKQEFISVIGESTGGLYVPREVTIVKGPYFEGCSSRKNSGKIKKLAEGLKRKDSINVVLTGTQPCKDDGIAGFASLHGDVVVTDGQMMIGPTIAAHEIGHVAGLDHSTVQECDDASYAACSLDELDPGVSIMNHIPNPELGRTHFSTPELYGLGLLSETQVMYNPPQGEYILNIPDGKHRNSLAALVLRGVSGKDVTLSVKPEYTDSCRYVLEGDSFTHINWSDLNGAHVACTSAPQIAVTESSVNDFGLIQPSSLVVRDTGTVRGPGGGAVIFKNKEVVVLDEGAVPGSVNTRKVAVIAREN